MHQGKELELIDGNTLSAKAVSATASLPAAKERYCYRDFKDNPSVTWIDGVRLLLCRGCAFEVKAMGNFLRANGLGYRAILVASPPEDILRDGNDDNDLPEDLEMSQEKGWGSSTRQTTYEDHGVGLGTSPDPA